MMAEIPKLALKREGTCFRHHPSVHEANGSTPHTADDV